MADKPVTHCPLCGNKVPEGVAKCPVCATELRQVTAKSAPQALRSELQTEDFLHRELPRISLPTSKHSCPMCALELKGTESKCPRCGVPLAAAPKPQEEMLECRECGSLAPSGSKACPKCGVKFQVEVETPPAAPIPEYVPPPPTPSPPQPLPERPLPEITPPAPPPPAPSSQGLVNGRGAVNGTGFVNGTGMINGTKGVSMPSARARQRSFITKWQFLTILIAIIVIVPTFVYLSSSMEKSPFVIDGNFKEWSTVDTFSPFTTSGASSIDISEWAVVPESDQLFMYVRTDGSMMTGASAESFFLFVDSDNSPTTGYEVAGIGADYLLEVDGWNGSIQSTSVSEYPSGSDHLNWNSWQGLSSMSISAVGNQLEAMASLPAVVGPSARFLLMSQNSQEQNSLSYTVPAKGGLLVIRQEAGPAIRTDGTVAMSQSTAILRLNLTCDGADGTINSIAGSLANVPLSSPIEDVQLYVGVYETVDVVVDTSGAATGSSVIADIASAVIDSTFADVQIIGDRVAAYVGSAPSSIVIDGAFGDWIGRITADSDSVPNENPNIDISAVGAVNDSATSYFYVSVVGRMCAGSYVPFLKQIPFGGGGGGGVIPQRKTGEDILNIYVDSDMSATTGLPVSLSSKLIGADQKLEIRGLNGKVISRSLMDYQSGTWVYGTGTIAAANDDQRIEVSISSSSLNGASSIDYIIETTDWRARSDFATSVPQGTRALGGGLPTGASLDSWVVDSTTTSTGATSMSYQRKLFHDGTNFWSFYFDGANTVYRSSNDSGQTWSVPSRAFSSLAIGEASVWYDSGTSTVYIVGDDEGNATTGVHVRKGTVTKAPAASISWFSADQTVTVSSRNLAGKNTFISRDSSGFLWILSSNQTSPAGRYDLSAFRSRTANTTTGSLWFCTGNMVDTDSLQFNLKGSIVPASGGVMWAVYAYDGNVASRKYSGGAWSVTEIPIYIIANDGASDRNPANTDLAPPSVVVDSKDVVHVVFGNGHERQGAGGGPIPHTYYSYYNAAATWTTVEIGATDNRVGNFYPTISVDLATGNVFVLWIESDVSGSYHTLICRKNTTGTWTYFSLTGETTYVKEYLTSVYSATNENLIAWQWTQNSTAPIQVKFDKIPEFHDLAAPILMMTGLLILMQIRSRARRRDVEPGL